MTSLRMLQSLFDRFQIAGAKLVFGEPIETQGKTIIPVAKVGFGFGAGAGRGNHSGDDEDPGDRREEGFGGGGGVGASHCGAAPARRPRGEVVVGGGGGGGARPVGVVEVTPDATRMIPFGQGRWLAAAGLIGFVLGVLFGSRRGRKSR